MHVEKLAESCHALTSELEAAGVALTVVSGAEMDLLCGLDASPEDLQLATLGQAGRYLLTAAVEAAASVDPGYAVVRAAERVIGLLAPPAELGLVERWSHAVNHRDRLLDTCRGV